MRFAKAIIMLLVLLLSMVSQWLHFHREHGVRVQYADHATVGERCFLCEHIALQPLGVEGQDCMMPVMYKDWGLISFGDRSSDLFSARFLGIVNKGPPVIAVL